MRPTIQRLLHISLPALLVLLSGSPAGAQSAALEVLVRDESTGNALPGVMVVVVDGPIARTDGSGHAILLDIEPGVHRVEIAHPGYERESRELGFTAAMTLQYAVGLRLVVVEVAGVEVRGEGRVPRLDRSGFYDRQKLYPGAFILLEEIASARERGTPLSNVLRGRRGLSVQSNPNGRGFTAVASRTAGLSDRPCPLAIFVDGVRRYREPDLDRVIPMMDIEAIEVHTGVQTPLHYEGGCGAIVIWTRGQK